MSARKLGRRSQRLRKSKRALQHRNGRVRYSTASTNGSGESAISQRDDRRPGSVVAAAHCVLAAGPLRGRVDDFRVGGRVEFLSTWGARTPVDLNWETRQPGGQVRLRRSWKRAMWLTNFRSPPESGHPRYGRPTASFAPEA